MLHRPINHNSWPLKLDSRNLLCDTMDTTTGQWQLIDQNLDQFALGKKLAECVSCKVVRVGPDKPRSDDRVVCEVIVDIARHHVPTQIVDGGGIWFGNFDNLNTSSSRILSIHEDLLGFLVHSRPYVWFLWTWT